MMNSGLVKILMTKGNLNIERGDIVLPISDYYKSALELKMGIPLFWDKMTDPDGRWTNPPNWGGVDAKYIVNSLREIIEKYNLYRLFERGLYDFNLVLKPDFNWGINSERTPVLSDIGPKGIRSRIDEILSAHMSRDDIAWSKITDKLVERALLKETTTQAAIEFILKSARRHFNFTDDIWKEIRSQRAVFISIKGLDGNNLERNYLPSPLRGHVYIPTPAWQFEIVDKDLLIDDPLEQFHLQKSIT